jgi:hypothetical protein
MVLENFTVYFRFAAVIFLVFLVLLTQFNGSYPVEFAQPRSDWARRSGNRKLTQHQWHRA